MRIADASKLICLIFFLYAKIGEILFFIASSTQMVISVETTLNNALNQLRELSEGIEDLVNIYPDVFDDHAMNERLETFRKAYRESVNRLENPILSIATIGTTSSGKSTLVNALIGRKIAPIEAGEMSGGILTLRHSYEHKLVIKDTDGATWPTGSSPGGLSDDDLYKRIRDGVMFPYHEKRKEKTIIAPQVTVFVPLLPVGSQKLLGLPSGLGFEIIDLPGLKSIQDSDNLKVIQERVSKAFSLVVLDYLQVDDKHRERLLEELKKIVQYLQGRTDSMIFILNRVDMHNSDDIPIEKRINKLQEEIKKVLSLKKEPDILPFSSQLLYYAQCAWGSVTLDQQSTVDKITRLNLLKGIFRDVPIRKYIGDDNKELRSWFNNVEDQVLSGQDIDNSTMKQIVQYALKWSGGSNLWISLRARIQQSFPELVILPALIDVFDSYDALIDALKAIGKIRKIEKKEEIEAEQERIQKSRQRLPRLIDNIRDKFLDDIKNDIKLLKENNPEAKSLLAQKAQEAGRQGFQSLFQAVDDVEVDLIQFVIAPVRDALNNYQTVLVEDLENNLSEVLGNDISKKVSREYDSVTRKIKMGTFSSENGYLVKQVRTDKSKDIQNLEDAERAFLQLYQVMAEALSVRSNFQMQAQAKTIEEALEGLVKEQEKALYKICRQELPSLNLDEAIISYFNKKVAANPIILNDNFFDFPEPNKLDTILKREIISSKPESEEYETGWWIFKSKKKRTVTRDTYGNVEYSSLSLPDTDMMAKQWTNGIKQGKQKLWDVFYDWIISRLNWTSEVFDESINEVIDLAERSLDKQLRIIKEDFTTEMERWQKLEDKQAEVTEIRKNLEKQSHTPNSD